MQYNLPRKPAADELLANSIASINYRLVNEVEFQIQCDAAIFETLHNLVLAAGWTPTVKKYAIFIRPREQFVEYILPSPWPTSYILTPDEVTAQRAQIIGSECNIEKEEDDNDSCPIGIPKSIARQLYQAYTDPDGNHEGISIVRRINRAITDMYCGNELCVNTTAEVDKVSSALVQAGYTVNSAKEHRIVGFSSINTTPNAIESWTSDQFCSMVIPANVCVTNGGVLRILDEFENQIQDLCGEHFIDIVGEDYSEDVFYELKSLFDTAGMHLLVDDDGSWLVDVFGIAQPGDVRLFGQSSSLLHARPSDVPKTNDSHSDDDATSV